MATSYSNQGAVGHRLGEMAYTMSVSASSIGGFQDAILDGIQTGTSSATAFFLNTATRDYTLTFDWQDGQVIIDAFKWYQSTDNTHSTYVFEGSNNMADWTQIGSSFTLGGTRTSGFIEYTFTNSTAYRGYRIRQSAATDNNVTPWLQGIEFKIEEGTSGGITQRGSCFNPGGGLPVGGGTRTSIITVTSDAGQPFGSPPNLVNDNLTADATGSWGWTGGLSAREVKFDFGSGFTKYINGLAWRCSGTNDSGTWKIAGSNDDSIYTDLATGILFNKLTAYKFFTNTTAYRYYKLIQTAGTTNGTPWQLEVYFRIKPGASPGGGGVRPVLITAISG